jgi:hypothetical protein
MRFREASDVYMGSRTFVTQNGEHRTFNGRYIRATTVKNYRSYLRSLALFFSEMRLSEIRLDHLRKYQRARLAGEAPFIRARRPHQAPSPCPTKPQHVNQELCRASDRARYLVNVHNDWKTFRLQGKYIGR